MKALLVAVALFAAVPARADRASDLAVAGKLLGDGKYAEAEAATRPLLTQPLLRTERAETYRIRGLALFYLGQNADAEAALRVYLTLEPDAHLDPALHPPETVLFFEGVRARNAGAVLIARPAARRRRYGALNLLPPLGQWQNGETTKAWVIGAAEVALLATNIATYAMLKSTCHDTDLTCARDPSSARALRTVNLASGGLFFAVFAYGIIDGYMGSSRASAREQERAVRTALIPVPGGLIVGGSGRF